MHGMTGRARVQVCCVLCVAGCKLQVSVEGAGEGEGARSTSPR